MPRTSFLDRVYTALLPLVATVTNNPRALKPGELVRLLNTTPAGDVLTDRILRLHRERAGLRIAGEREKTLDLLKYAAWLCQQPRRTGGGDGRQEAGAGTAARAYHAKRERERARNAAASQEGRDIGPIPPIAVPARRERCETSLQAFCETYLAEQFPLEFSEDHLAAIKYIESSAIEGGLFAFAMPRGSGKTTLCEAAAIWTVLYGRRRFLALIGASADAANEILDSIRTEFETNDLLAADFPEVCFPISKLGGINNRASAQLCCGERTRITWGKKSLVFPSIPGSRAAGTIIKSSGIDGRVRGMRHKLSDGTSLRPDLVIVDDPQTDRTARSEDQCRKRVATLAGSVLGLAGPGKKIAGFMPCTVIVQGDMADQILDRERHPAWHGTRLKLLYTFPTNNKLWEEYADLRRTSFRNGGKGEEATKFYRKHRQEMDAGAKIAWPQRYNKDELSAIQNAMNLFIDNEAAFWAESQNAPLKEASDDEDLPTNAQIAGKINQLSRSLVPQAATKLTAMIDVQHKLLYWVVVAWTDKFGGYVLDYGTFPEQQRVHFKLRDVRHNLAKIYPGQSMESQVYHGLTDLISQLCERDFAREEGGHARIERLLVDSADGMTSDIVMRVCRTHPHKVIVLPSLGRAIKKGEKPMHQYAKKEGETIGYHWLLQRSLKHAVKQLVIDTNFWKSFVQRGLAAPLGERHALSLYGTQGTRHLLFADHCTSEARTRVPDERTGSTHESWKLKPGQSDNHWFDCLVGTAAAASQLGISVDAGTDPRRQRRRITAADIPQRRRA
ncbi:MAG: terminase gpA endonuclease subunit [Pirellulales bacterium]|nr:terminase gpA endonuclease subunit [Pirellulales bacterium]